MEHIHERILSNTFPTVEELALELRREDSGLAEVKIFACDMAQGNVPSAPKERGHWIQLTSQLRNPWWGAEMLECGAEIKP